MRESECVALCTFVPFRFDALKTSHKTIRFVFFSSFLRSIQHLLLFLLSRLVSSHIVSRFICSFCVLAVYFTLYFEYIYFVQFFSYFRDYIHTMECLLSACVQVALFFVRFVSFYVLNIALISFRCGFSLFNISPVCSVAAAAGFFHNFVSFICVRARVANIVISTQLLRLTFSMFFA